MKKPTILERLKKIEDLLFKPAVYATHTKEEVEHFQGYGVQTGRFQTQFGVRYLCNFSWNNDPHRCTRNRAHHCIRKALGQCSQGHLCACGETRDPDYVTRYSHYYANHAEHWFNKFQQAELEISVLRDEVQRHIKDCKWWVNRATQHSETASKMNGQLVEFDQKFAAQGRVTKTLNDLIESTKRTVRQLILEKEVLTNSLAHEVDKSTQRLKNIRLFGIHKASCSSRLSLNHICNCGYTKVREDE